MTTIAYKEGVIACDGRITSNTSICTDTRDKRIVRKDGVQFFVCGNDELVPLLVGAWPDGEMPSDSFNAFVLDGGTLWFVGADGGRIWRSIQARDEPNAIGSGSEHALTAMDMGCSAKEAVKMAAKRDTCTGGRIRTYRIPEAS